MTQKKQRLLMLGDSLVEWGDWDALLPELEVLNRGIAGEPAEGLSARLFSEIDQAPEAEHVLIMSGTNNLLMGSPHFPAIFSTMLPRLAGLCRQSAIVVNAIMPMTIRGLARETIAQVNRELRETAVRSGCRFLDPAQPFAESCLPITRPCFMTDGVHLSTLGYQVWAREIRRCCSSSRSGSEAGTS